MALSVLQGELYPIFFIMSDVCKLMTKSLHRLIDVWNLNFGASIYGV